MKRYERTLLYVSGIIMDLSWLYAWATFSVISLGGNPLPLMQIVALFIFGAVISRVVHGRGFRVITVGLVQALAACAALFWTMHFLSGSQRTIIDLAWTAEFFITPHPAAAWLYFITGAFWTVAIWLSGVCFPLRPATHAKVSSRFDTGLAAFLCLVLIRFVIEMKGGPPAQGGLIVISACVFLFFGLLAIGITRAQGPEAASLIYGRRKMGIVLGFISAVFLTVVSLVVFLRQPLSLVAGVGYNALTQAGSSLGSLFARFIRFLYLPRQVRIKEPPSGGQGSIFDHVASSGGGPWMETAAKMLAWLFGTFAGIMIVIIIVTGAVWIIRRLLARTRKDGRPAGRSSHFLATLLRFKAFVAGSLRYLGRCRTASDFYRALKIWSRLSGIRPAGCETPLEFSDRIKETFPAIGLEIDSITHAFNREFYGNITLGRDEIRSVRSSWRKMTTPRLWPGRLKTLVKGTVNLRS